MSMFILFYNEIFSRINIKLLARFSNKLFFNRSEWQRIFVSHYKSSNYDTFFLVLLFGISQFFLSSAIHLFSFLKAWRLSKEQQLFFFFFFLSFSYQRWSMVSDWSWSDIRFPKVSRTFLSILAKAKKCCSFESFHSSYSFQAIQSSFQSFDNCTKSSNCNWYHCHFHVS